MKKSLIKSSVLVVSIAALLIAAACGGSSCREDWLVRTGEDTLFVDDARVLWEGMTLESRQMFLESPDPRELLVVTMARKALISNEIREQGILSEPEMVAFKDLWIGIESGIVCRRIQVALEREALTEEEIQFYTDYFGYKVWFTENPGSSEEVSLGPEMLVNHDNFSVARQLAVLEPGEIIPGPDGVRFRLDNLEPPDSAFSATISIDSISLAEEARVFISQQRARDWYLELEEELPANCNLAVDTTLVSQLAGFYAGTENIDLSSIVIHSEMGDWTVIDLIRAVSFVDTRMRGNPALDSWLYFVINNVLMHDYFRIELAENYPSQFDSLITEADKQLMSMAVDTLYNREVVNRVQVRSADIEAEFNRQDPPVMTEEMRVFRTAVVSPEEISTLQGSTDLNSALLELPGYAVLSSPDSDPSITGPLTAGMIPGGYGQELFQQVPQDTVSWCGPSDIPGSEDKIYWQLMEVIPSRYATLDELAPQLSEIAYQRLMQERVELWVAELEESHGMVINTALIETLPEDPGIWFSDAL